MILLSHLFSLYNFYCLSNDKRIRLKSLVQRPGGTFGYRVAHQNSLTSCPGNDVNAYIIIYYVLILYLYNK